MPYCNWDQLSREFPALGQPASGCPDDSAVGTLLLRVPDSLSDARGEIAGLRRGTKVMGDSHSTHPSPEERSVLDVACDGDTIVITPRGDLGEFVVSMMADEAEAALDHWKTTPGRLNLILDLNRTDYFGSSALGFFIRLWKRVRESGGQMVLCNASPHEIELLKVTRLDEFWRITESLQDAKDIVTAAAATNPDSRDR